MINSLHEGKKMGDDVFVKTGIVIPEHELEITASRAGGPGGQHVNKTSTKITVRWNVKSTNALYPDEKARVMEKLASRLTNEGDLIINNSASRSQEQNRKNALQHLGTEIRNALIVPKKRMKTRVSKSAKETRLGEKSHRGEIKKMRKVKFDE